MCNQHEVRGVGRSLHIGRGALGSGALVSLPGEQAPVAQHENAQRVDERQGAGLFREGVGIERLRLDVFVVELQRQPGAQRQEEVPRGTVDEIALASVNQGDHAATKARSIFAAM